MLSGAEILNQMKLGNIEITPFNKEQINPNSYNITLGSELYIYTTSVLDSKGTNTKKKITLGPEGYTLTPGTLYLAETNEHTVTKKHIPQLSGRSSIGRIGLSVHMNAGLGAIGYSGKWSLGLTCIIPVKVYPGMQIGQIYYVPVEGEV